MAWGLCASMLIAWSAVMVVGAVVGEAEEEKYGVVAHWERSLHGTKMPSSIHAMVTPLSPEQVTQLLVVATKNLPEQAAALCKAARIKCVPNGPTSKERTLPLFYNSDGPETLPFFAYDVDGPASKERTLPLFYDLDGPETLPFFAYDSNGPASKERTFHSSEDAEALSTASQSKPIQESSKSPQSRSMLREVLSSSVPKLGAAFREKQVLVVGQTISVETPIERGGGVDGRAFLPPELAALFPLDDGGSKITSLLRTPKQAMKAALRRCQPRDNGVVRACLTSLEDVADFVSNIIPSTTPIEVYDTFTNASSFNSAAKEFTVLKVKTLKQDLDAPSVSCHDMGLPFRTFDCHYPKQTKGFAVTLQAEDGSVHDRVVNCHYDTSDLNADNPILRQLFLKPGEGEVCHWLGRTWMGKNGWLFVHA